MAKELAVKSGVILIVIAVATALSNYGIGQMGKGQDLGILKTCVENNTANIQRLDKEGTQQLKNAMERMAVLETMLANIKDDITDNRVDLKEIKQILMNPVR